MSYTAPTVSEFKAYFVRDFPYGATTAEVMDADITRALTETDFSMNEELFDTQSEFTVGYQLLAAHNLVMNLRASSQGIAGQYSWLQQSKSAGSVAESFAIPQRILDNPQFAMLTKTNYGAKFLQFVLPKLTGQVLCTPGGTNA